MQTQICMQIWVNIQIQLQQSKYWLKNTLFRQHFGWEVRWGLHDSYQGRSSWRRLVYGKKVIAVFFKWHSSDDRSLLDRAHSDDDDPIPSMYGIFTYIWLIFVVNVSEYTIHGSYGWWWWWWWWWWWSWWWWYVMIVMLMLMMIVTTILTYE